MLNRKKRAFERKSNKAQSEREGAKYQHGLKVLNTRDIKLTVLIIGERFRPPRDEDIAKLAESLKTIGQARPITVRKHAKKEGKYSVIAGASLVKAAELLGWTTIRAEIVKCSNVEARLWEIAENLYRAALTALEEADHIAEWVRILAARKEVFGQVVAKPKGGRPEGTITKAARKLPIKGGTQVARRKAIERALKIAGMTPEGKAAAREAGLDKNRSALTDIAMETTPETQVEKVEEIVKRKAEAQASKHKRKCVKKSKPITTEAEEETPGTKHPDEVLFAELKSECSQNFQRTWGKASTKVRRRFLREVLHWEGGKPASKSD